MDAMQEKEKTEATAAFLRSMPVPRPFTTARFILARGAIGWYVNLIVALVVGGLLVLSARSLGAGSSAAASLVIIAALGFVFYRLILRIIEPFRISKLLREGMITVVPIIEKMQTTSLFSRIGSKLRSRYIFGWKKNTALETGSTLIADFDGTEQYQGESCVLLFHPSEDEEARPTAFFALSCFLYHRALAFPDLLETKEAQEKAKTAITLDDDWHSVLGKTAASLFGRLIMTLVLIVAIGGALFLVLSRGN
ncbi:hypothetical protein [Sediminispirochaeta bajacaliforniensis]|uniref:hypothetical protein n=1 Tax=Sediminispirochaeta bajacaliforniensis TaxID=148 RepID=UPI000379488D|nr:hypothetical protein [Sediminispirochaeta bajacaliforniensis]